MIALDPLKTRRSNWKINVRNWRSMAGRNNIFMHGVSEETYTYCFWENLGQKCYRVLVLLRCWYCSAIHWEIFDAPSTSHIIHSSEKVKSRFLRSLPNALLRCLFLKVQNFRVFSWKRIKLEFLILSKMLSNAIDRKKFLFSTQSAMG